MVLSLSRMISLRHRATGAAPLGDATVEAAAPAVPVRHPRIGLWVLSSFATIAALVAISALVIGPQNADLMVMIPLVLFWTITVSVGLAVRSALVNVAKSLARRRKEKPDATLERLARMVRSERNRAERCPHLARGLVHVG